ncbi:MAG: hypothetical protein CL744_08755 [Chloroflexi bacterium]|nr:hypothetical protein [Chloroflexota bacterium]
MSGFRNCRLKTKGPLTLVRGLFDFYPWFGSTIRYCRSEQPGARFARQSSPLFAQVAVNLSFDLFPKGWSGFALISVPGYGWTTPWFSGAWIAISTVVCTYLGVRLVRNWFDGCLLVMSLICVFAYVSIGEEAFWRPVVVLAVVIRRRADAGGASDQLL